MNRSICFASGVVALSIGIVCSSNGSAFGQMRGSSIGARYGIGPEGTIGRGTAHMRDGPSDPDGVGTWRGYGPRRGYVYPSTAASSSSGSGYTYSSGYGGYSSAPRTFAPQAAPTPYLTNRYYEPGDGYRYPLYYNPSTATYFYYPVRR